MNNERKALQLAEMAGCDRPDSPMSPGARYLHRVADSFYDSLDEIREDDYPEDCFLEMAEPSVYTQEMWTEFVDIATNESPEIDGTMEQMASYCLVQIGQRLLSALWEEAQAEGTEG